MIVTTGETAGTGSGAAHHSCQGNNPKRFCIKMMMISFASSTISAIAAG
jgi:hypothetical protein